MTGTLPNICRESPENRRALKKTVEDIRTFQAVPRQIEPGGLEEAMRQIVADFRKGAENYLAETKRLTSEIMRKITGSPRTQMNAPARLRGITPKTTANSIIGCLEGTELTEEQKDAFRANLTLLFKPLGMGQERV